VTPDSTNRRSDDIGAVNQAVLAALLARDWAALDRLVPRSPVPDPDEEE
jgi:hypothetical protein